MYLVRERIIPVYRFNDNEYSRYLRDVSRIEDINIREQFERYGRLSELVRRIELDVNEFDDYYQKMPKLLGLIKYGYEQIVRYETYGELDEDNVNILKITLDHVERLANKYTFSFEQDTESN